MGSHHGTSAHGQTQRRFLEPQTHTGKNPTVGSTVDRPHPKNLLREEATKTMQTDENTDYTRQQSVRTSQGAEAAQTVENTASDEHTEKVVHPVLPAADHSMQLRPCEAQGDPHHNTPKTTHQESRQQAQYLQEGDLPRNPCNEKLGPLQLAECDAQLPRKDLACARE
mmetsp:Transcript_75543/g.180488  ORF Transcript_75543/g.180488 Transcript_75543/m.180488 type:complete len:168 (+) Transcript_75543:15-518(+)